MKFEELKYLLPIIIFASSAAHADDALRARAEVNWRYGSERSILMSEFWVPFAQQSDAVFYGDLRMMGDDHDNHEGNLGIGYRKMTQAPVLGPGVAGAHVWIDRRLTALGSAFHQATIGGEWLGENVDILANAYVPLSDGKQHSIPNANPSGPALVGTGIFVDTDGMILEEPQHGFDIELGWQVPFLEDHTDSFRVYGGGYYFNSSNTQDVAGWRTRVAADVTSNMQFGARFQRDDERGSQGFLEATIRFPFGQKKSFRKEGLRARLDDSPERDIDIVTGSAVTDAGERVQVLNAITGAAQEVLHVDNTAAGGGDGSAETPFNTLAAAQAASSAQGIIYVHTGDGTTANQDVGITLNKSGQQLIGAGTNFIYDGSRFTTANGQNASSTLILAATTAPTITNVNALSDGITVAANNVRIAGVKVDGATRDGILVEADGGAASAQNVVITDVTAINNRHGIYIHGTNGGTVSAMVQGSAVMTNTQHGIAVYDDTAGTFEVDLGGGTLGSTGNNVLAGNTLEDLAVELDGGTLQAQNNWWGQAGGALATQIYKGAPINTGLAGHWTFDPEHITGVTATDRSGNGNDATLFGGTTLITGTAGEAVSFDGNDDFVRLGAVLAAPDNWTYSFWFNPTVMQDQGAEGLIGETNNPRIQWGAFGMPYEATVRTFSAFAGGGNAFGSKSADITIGDWHYVVMTATNASTAAPQVILYVDNVSIVNNYGAALRRPIATHYLNFRDGNNIFLGSIDDTRIYNRALTPAEVSELFRMDATSSVNTSGFLTAAP